MKAIAVRLKCSTKTARKVRELVADATTLIGWDWAPPAPGDTWSVRPAPLSGGEALSDPTQDRLVSAAIAGIARRVGSSAQAAGLRTDSFARMLATLELGADPHTPRGRMAIRDAALLSVMRDGLLRRGEAAALQWDDLTIEDDGSGRLVVQRSKTDQTSEGAVLWISPQTIEVTERWWEVAGTGSSMFDLSARSVGRVVIRRAEAVGLAASGHSLRVGGWPRTWPPPAPPFRGCVRLVGGSPRQWLCGTPVLRRPTGER